MILRHLVHLRYDYHYYHERRNVFSLTKTELFDSIYLGYGWGPKNQSEACVCKPKYNIDHALTSKTGGFMTLRPSLKSMQRF